MPIALDTLWAVRLNDVDLASIEWQLDRELARPATEGVMIVVPTLYRRPGPLSR